MKKAILGTVFLLSSVYSFSCYGQTYSDDYFKCLDDNYDQNALICIQEERVRDLRNFDALMNKINQTGYFQELTQQKIEIKEYIALWKKYADSICSYFSDAFGREYPSGKSIKTKQENELKYEECQKIELSAAIRRFDRILQDIEKKQNKDNYDDSL